MRADQIMTRKVITVGPDTSIIDAAKTMLDHHVGGLPVVDDAGKLVGMVSDGDFIRRAEIGTERQHGRWLRLAMGSSQIASDFIRAHGRKVGDIMTPNPLTVTADSPIEQVVRVMESNNVKRLPVVSGDLLVGIITHADFVQAIANLAADVPDPTADDDQISRQVFAAIEKVALQPCRFTVTVRDGVVHLSGAVRDEKSRKLAILAADSVPGVKKIQDHLWIYPPPEEDLGGGDIASLQEQASTEDDQPL